MTQSSVRVAVIGIGRMGSRHAEALRSGRIAGAELVAVCDPDPGVLSDFSEIERFSDASALFARGLAQAVVIATPHYAHTSISIAALSAGLHVLTEKPFAVHKADAERMLEAHAGRPASAQVFGVAFGMRLDPRFMMLRELLQSGALGALERIQWTATDWFRSDAYYRSRPWRGTWANEGGGVLVNQASHNLDLWVWLFGMPRRVQALCALGRFHPIEVEDQVAACFEYSAGHTAVFVASTAEAPGTNRLEVVGDRGQLLLEADRLTVTRRAVPLSEQRRIAPEAAASPRTWQKVTRFPKLKVHHLGVIQNFIDAIGSGVPLLVPAREGLFSVELSNAILYSSLTGQAVRLPLSAEVFEQRLEVLSRAQANRLEARVAMSALPEG